MHNLRCGYWCFQSQASGRTRGEAPVNARKHVHLVRLCAGGAHFACSAALIHLARNVCLVHRHAARQGPKVWRPRPGHGFRQSGKRNGASRTCRSSHALPNDGAQRLHGNLLQPVFAGLRTFTSVMVPSGPVFLSCTDKFKYFIPVVADTDGRPSVLYTARVRRAARRALQHGQHAQRHALAVVQLAAQTGLRFQWRGPWYGRSSAPRAGRPPARPAPPWFFSSPGCGTQSPRVLPWAPSVSNSQTSPRPRSAPPSRPLPAR